MTENIDLPILNLNFKDSFDQLDENEKKYTYYLNKACWSGIPIVLFEVSYESPALFIIFQNFFSSFQSFNEMKKIILSDPEKKITEADYEKFLRYAAKFYVNIGNYSSFDSKKFIPLIPSDKFESILKTSNKYTNEIEYTWDCIQDLIYDNSPNCTSINLEEKNGKNFYYLGGIKEEQINKIDKLLKEKNIDPINTRLIMISPEKFVVLISSIEEKIENLTNEVVLYYGEFKDFLLNIKENLTMAKKYTTNENEKRMIDLYIESFTTGNIEKFKESQREWVKNKTPIIEFNIGWIETYIDPLGVRGCYEGWVAITDKEKSKKYSMLIENISTLLKNDMPWDENFEKDKINLPNFVALDVVGFASNLCPIGINAPNYIDIQETEGSKNISLSNAYPNFNAQNLPFCSQDDIDILSVYSSQSMNIHTACHELLGHNSGKLLRKNKDGSFNFDIDNVINPLTNNKIDKYYINDESYEDKFNLYARPLEELRADLIVLYFSFNPIINEIFEIDNTDKLIYSLWLIYLRKGILGLELYNEQNEKWGHSQIQSAFIFANYVIKNQKSGEEILKIEIKEKENNNFSINLNKDMLLCFGKDLVSDILLKIHIWKCTGDFDSVKEFYDNYSKIDEFFLKIRNILCNITIPRRLELNHNLNIDEENLVTVIEYPESKESIIQSFIDRFHTDYNKIIYDQWIKYDSDFLNKK